MLEIPLSDRVPMLGFLTGGQPLDVDIAGTPGAIGYRYWLGQTDKIYWMAVRAEKEALLHASVGPGEWHFGLWYFDCAELFLGCSATGRYLEVNLAPNGAYWVGVFEGPRRFLEGASPEMWTVAAMGSVETDSWSAFVAMTREEVVAALGGEPDRGNVTAILGGCPDVDVPPENLRSVAPIDPVSPDFHVPDRFVAVRV